MRQKKIQYVSLEAGAFLSDPLFQIMKDGERGVYCSLIFYLYENQGVLPFDETILKGLCNSKNFSKTWEKIKRKFTVKDGELRHKRVSAELERVRRITQIQSEAGKRGNDKRWKKDVAGQSPGETKRSETDSGKLKGFISSAQLAAFGPGELETLKFRIYDILSGIFGGKSSSDSKSLRNLIRWAGEQITAGKFAPEIFKRIVNMAVESKNGKSRKPIAVFFAQVKSELGYKKDD